MNNCIKDQQPQSKSVPIFKSITFPNHTYFRVETIRQNPQLKQSNSNNHSNSKFTTFQTPGINGGNLVNGSVSTKKVNFTSSLSVDPKYPSCSHNDQGIQEDLSKKVIEQVGELISKKKLNFNAIWTTKIPKEELNTPKDFQDQSFNSEVYSIIFNSIAQLSKHINDLFEKIINEKNNIETQFIYNELIMCLGALKQKIMNFTLTGGFRHFKDKHKEKEEVFHVLAYLNYIHDTLQSELAKNIAEIYTVVKEFCQNLR